MAGSEKALEIVDKWKHGWMRQEDYRQRAMGVDSNMRHSLATMIDEALAAEREKCTHKFCPDCLAKVLGK